MKNIDVIPNKTAIGYTGPPNEFARIGGQIGIKKRLDSQWDCTDMIFSKERFKSYCYLCKLTAKPADIESYEFMLKGIIRCELSKDMRPNTLDIIKQQHLRRLFGVVKKPPTIRSHERDYEENLNERRENLNNKFKLAISEDSEPINSWHGVINLKIISPEVIKRCPVASWEQDCPHEGKLNNNDTFVLLQFQDCHLRLTVKHIKNYYHLNPDIKLKDIIDKYCLPGNGISTVDLNSCISSINSTSLLNKVITDYKLSEVLNNFLNDKNRSKSLRLISNKQCPL